MEETYKINPLLVRKYNQPVPHYTSYPTKKFWNNNLLPETWSGIFKQEFNNINHTEGIGIYVHLPFCENLCGFCGCNKKITTNHTVEEEYLAAIEKEWKQYRSLMQQTPVIRSIHFGGGTPTFFTAKNLERLLSLLLNNSIIHPVYEFSIEGHPNSTSKKHLEILYAAGFRRISFGIQDINVEVQKIINNIQPFENVKNVTAMARETGFTGITFDLLYGLPTQTIDSLQKTITQVLSLAPGRIVFKCFEPVQSADVEQGQIVEKDLPALENRISMYVKGKEMLLQNGYYEIGMDHFSLPTDGLYKAMQKGRLIRNFMGYTTQSTGLLLGLGVSGISNTGNAYAQNATTLPAYYDSLNGRQPAISKGYLLNEEDQLFRKNIVDISCKGKTIFSEKQQDLLEQFSFPKLSILAADELVKYDTRGMQVTPKGHYFIRNICSAFDLHLLRSKSHTDLNFFSRAI